VVKSSRSPIRIDDLPEAHARVSPRSRLPEEICERAGFSQFIFRIIDPGALPAAGKSGCFRTNPPGALSCFHEHHLPPPDDHLSSGRFPPFLALSAAVFVSSHMRAS
jgi:hypothetical protein